jgi:hypothetical protein
VGVVPEFRKSLVLRWNASPDFDASPGYIGTDGFVWLSSGWSLEKRLGQPQAGENYLQDVANIVGGHIRRPEKNWPDVTGPNGRQVELSELLKTPEKWKAAIAQLIEETTPTSPDVIDASKRERRRGPPSASRVAPNESIRRRLTPGTTHAPWVKTHVVTMESVILEDRTGRSRRR